MFKQLILALRKSDFETAKSILRENNLHDLIQADVGWVHPKVFSVDSDDDVVVYEGEELYKQHMEVLSSAVYHHVDKPDVIYEFLLAGLSPAWMVRMFINDPYRLSMVVRLLPVLAFKLECESKLEEINVSGGVKSIDDNKSYAATDFITQSAPKFPVIYNNFTNDLQDLIDTLYVRQIKIADDTNYYRVLDELIDKVNQERENANLPKLNETQDESEIQHIAKQAADKSSANLDMHFNNMFFAFEVYETMKGLGIPLQKHNSLAVVTALSAYLKSLNEADLMCFSILLMYLLATSYTLHSRGDSLVAIPTLGLLTIQAYTMYNFVSHSFVKEKPNFNRTLYSFYQSERFPYAESSRDLVAKISERHRAKNPIDYQDKISKGLYFWRKVISPLPQSEVIEDMSSKHVKQVKCKLNNQ